MLTSGFNLLTYAITTNEIPAFNLVYDYYKKQPDSFKKQAFKALFTAIIIDNDCS